MFEVIIDSVEFIYIFSLWTSMWIFLYNYKIMQTYLFKTHKIQNVSFHIWASFKQLKITCARSPSSSLTTNVCVCVFVCMCILMIIKFFVNVFTNTINTLFRRQQSQAESLVLKTGYVQFVHKAGAFCSIESTNYKTQRTPLVIH